MESFNSTKFKSIALTQPSLGSLGRSPQTNLPVSPFGALVRAFTDEIFARVAQQEGLYPYVPLDFLDDADPLPAPPRREPPILQLDVHLVLAALRQQKPLQEYWKTVERILERVISIQDRQEKCRESLPASPLAHPKTDETPVPASRLEQNFFRVFPYSLQVRFFPAPKNRITLSSRFPPVSLPYQKPMRESPKYRTIPPATPFPLEPPPLWRPLQSRYPNIQNIQTFSPLASPKQTGVSTSVKPEPSIAAWASSVPQQTGEFVFLRPEQKPPQAGTTAATALLSTVNIGVQPSIRTLQPLLPVAPMFPVQTGVSASVKPEPSIATWASSVPHQTGELVFLRPERETPQAGTTKEERVTTLSSTANTELSSLAQPLQPSSIPTQTGTTITTTALSSTVSTGILSSIRPVQPLWPATLMSPVQANMSTLTRKPSMAVRASSVPQQAGELVLLRPEQGTSQTETTTAKTGIPSSVQPSRLNKPAIFPAPSAQIGVSVSPKPEPSIVTQLSSVPQQTENTATTAFSSTVSTGILPSIRPLLPVPSMSPVQVGVSTSVKSEPSTTARVSNAPQQAGELVFLRPEQGISQTETTVVNMGIPSPVQSSRLSKPAVFSAPSVQIGVSALAKPEPSIVIQPSSVLQQMGTTTTTAVSATVSTGILPSIRPLLPVSHMSPVPIGISPAVKPKLSMTARASSAPQQAGELVFLHPEQGTPQIKSSPTRTTAVSSATSMGFQSFIQPLLSVMPTSPVQTGISPAAKPEPSMTARAFNIPQRAGTLVFSHPEQETPRTQFPATTAVLLTVNTGILPSVQPWLPSQVGLSAWKPEAPITVQTSSVLQQTGELVFFHPEQETPQTGTAATTANTGLKSLVQPLWITSLIAFLSRKQAGKSLVSPPEQEEALPTKSIATTAVLSSVNPSVQPLPSVIPISPTQSGISTSSQMEPSLAAQTSNLPQRAGQFYFSRPDPEVPQTGISITTVSSATVSPGVQPLAQPSWIMPMSPTQIGISTFAKTEPSIVTRTSSVPQQTGELIFLHPEQEMPQTGISAATARVNIAPPVQPLWIISQIASLSRKRAGKPSFFPSEQRTPSAKSVANAAVQPSLQPLSSIMPASFTQIGISISAKMESSIAPRTSRVPQQTRELVFLHPEQKAPQIGAVPSTASMTSTNLKPSVPFWPSAVLPSIPTKPLATTQTSTVPQKRETPSLLKSVQTDFQEVLPYQTEPKSLLKSISIELLAPEGNTKILSLQEKTSWPRWKYSPSKPEFLLLSYLFSQADSREKMAHFHSKKYRTSHSAQMPEETKSLFADTAPFLEETALEIPSAPFANELHLLSGEKPLTPLPAQRSVPARLAKKVPQKRPESKNFTFKQLSLPASTPSEDNYKTIVSSISFQTLSGQKTFLPFSTLHNWTTFFQARTSISKDLPVMRTATEKEIGQNWRKAVPIQTEMLPTESVFQEYQVLQIEQSFPFPKIPQTYLQNILHPIFSGKVLDSKIKSRPVLAQNMRPGEILASKTVLSRYNEIRLYPVEEKSSGFSRVEKSLGFPVLQTAAEKVKIVPLFKRDIRIATENNAIPEAGEVRVDAASISKMPLLPDGQILTFLEREKSSSNHVEVFPISARDIRFGKGSSTILSSEKEIFRLAVPPLPSVETFAYRAGEQSLSLFSAQKTIEESPSFKIVKRESKNFPVSTQETRVRRENNSILGSTQSLETPLLLDGEVFARQAEGKRFNVLPDLRKIEGLLNLKAVSNEEKNLSRLNPDIRIWKTDREMGSLQEKIPELSFPVSKVQLSFSLDGEEERLIYRAKEGLSESQVPNKDLSSTAIQGAAKKSAESYNERIREKKSSTSLPKKQQKIQAVIAGLKPLLASLSSLSGETLTAQVREYLDTSEEKSIKRGLSSAGKLRAQPTVLVKDIRINKLDSPLIGNRVFHRMTYLHGYKEKTNTGEKLLEESAQVLFSAVQKMQSETQFSENSLKNSSAFLSLSWPLLEFKKNFQEKSPLVIRPARKGEIPTSSSLTRASHWLPQTTEKPLKREQIDTDPLAPQFPNYMLTFLKQTSSVWPTPVSQIPTSSASDSPSSTPHEKFTPFAQKFTSFSPELPKDEKVNIHLSTLQLPSHPLVSYRKISLRNVPSTDSTFSKGSFFSTISRKKHTRFNQKLLNFAGLPEIQRKDTEFLVSQFPDDSFVLSEQISLRNTASFSTAISDLTFPISILQDSTALANTSPFPASYEQSVLSQFPKSFSPISIEPIELTHPSKPSQDDRKTVPDSSASKNVPAVSGTTRYLPDWAQRFLRESVGQTISLPSVSTIQGVSKGKIPAVPSPTQPETVWTAPQYRPPEPLAYREKRGEIPLPPEPANKGFDLERAADQVYRMLESRIRRERRRLGL